jgi:uncharacterized BrkB/YihY/UPF0761 family membrane protein
MSILDALRGISGYSGGESATLTSQIFGPPVWKPVGAVFTALLFVLGKMLLALYLGRASPGSPYGAAGSVVVVVIWVYYSAQIFYFGAELTHVYAMFRRNTAQGEDYQSGVAA